MFRQISSSDPKYLSATDILIGDMSDINYEFLLFDRPIVLLANEWLKQNFPDIGIKTSMAGLSGAMERSLKDPGEFSKNRKTWLEKTIYKPDGASAKRVLDTILQYSRIKLPDIFFIHGDSEIRKSNLRALMQEAVERGHKVNFVSKLNTESREDAILVAVHFEDLSVKGKGYYVHLDHGLKGKGTANVEFSKKDYERHGYFTNINLHITAGQAGQERTEMLLGPLKERAVIAGYPKADDLMRFNTPENRLEVCRELGFDHTKPIITYAPAGEESCMKPGGSLNSSVIKELRRIASGKGYNMLIKLKYPADPFLVRMLKRLKKCLTL